MKKSDLPVGSLVAISNRLAVKFQAEQFEGHNWRWLDDGSIVDDDTVFKATWTDPPGASALTTEQAAAVHGLTELDTTVWFDLSERFTCPEAEAVAEFLSAFYTQDEGRMFLAYHSCGDDEGDQHRPVFDHANRLVDFALNEEGS